MAIITKGYTFNAGAVVVASEHNSNFDVIINDYNSNITNANLSASAGIPDTKLAQITTAGKVAGVALTSLLVNYFPQRATMWHDEVTIITGSAFVHAVNTSCRYNSYTYGGSYNNSFSNSFFLKAGDYTFYVLGVTGNNAGKIDWYIDNMVTPAISGQDWYSSPMAYNVVKTASVTISTDGYHKLVGTISGKNASSSNYVLGLIKYWLQPATDGART